MSDQKVIGYRELSDNEIKRMNECKELAVRCGELVQELRSKGSEHDQRWVSIGATDLQTGFMAIIRSIAQPSTF